MVNKNRKRSYELMFIVNPELNEEEHESLLERVQGYLRQAGSQIFSFKSWGIRRLAYSLKGCKEGHYYLVHFTMPTENVAGFRRSLLLAEGILREIVTLSDEEFVGEPLAEKVEEAPVEAPIEAPAEDEPAPEEVAEA